MTTPRKTSFLLLALDAGATIVVFNLISISRRLSLDGGLILSPLAGPLAFLVFALYLVDGYRGRTDMASLDYISLHGIAMTGAMLATLLVTYVFVPRGYELQSSRAVIALSFLLLIPATLGYRHVLARRTERARRLRSVLFVGDEASRQAFASECETMRLAHPVRFVPVASVDGVTPTSDLTLHTALTDISSGKSPVEAIVLRESHRGLSSDVVQDLMQLYFGGVPTYTLELFHQVYWQKIPLYRLNPTWLFQEGFQIAREPVFERLKRASDIVLSALGLILASPLIALAAAAIWLDDRGPVWFFQSRVGRNQRRFRLVKLRTMRADASPVPAPADLYTRDRDPRITRVGHFLRKSRLDELPQLWNVLRGEMSLIGPRAEWDRLVADYEARIPCYSYRHLVKPGITGWAQVNYPYGASLEDTLRKLEYDLYYIRHFSFLLDASIALKTIQIMIFGKGR
ncbi:MAG TPA: exopolysaccharide biosynthesis polyprenyl glycosylphosphotransferase [Opitutaceae bacterium]|jgi:exopolysaccharide biosynthesis polyprenyl glycosylphosphotransferase|nr:exopolysaccharide biosynthesis polyprenyl glycosylphosphotransferase [Opitutaceae bacterium]